MEARGKQRAADEFRRAVERLGLTPTDVARLGEIPDPDTVRDFMDGARWPRTPTRNKLERAIGWQVGTISALAVGEEIAIEPAEDRVVAAIEESELTRANRHRLIGTYYDMLDRQGSEPSAEVRGA